MTWSRHPDAANYRVSGEIHYYNYVCRDGPHFTPKGSPKFSEVLPADRLWFEFPPADDAGANFVSEYDFQLEALSRDGSVLVTDDLGLTNEPRPCPEDLSSRAPRGSFTGGRTA